MSGLRPRITIGWMMTHIAVIGTASALWIASWKEAQASRCGTGLFLTEMLLLGLGLLYIFVRLALYGVRHPS